jgi:hypothetical protein
MSTYLALPHGTDEPDEGTEVDAALWCFACGDILGLAEAKQVSRCSCGASVLTRIDQGFLYSGPAEGVDRFVISPADSGRALERYVRRRDDDLLRRAEIQPLI